VAFPVIKAATYILAHTPDLVQYGSKPTREIAPDDRVQHERLAQHLRGFSEAVAYAPNQTFVGNLSPDALATLPRPWHRTPLAAASRFGRFGEIMPEEEFYGLLKIVDRFELVSLIPSFAECAATRLAAHPLADCFARSSLERTTSPDVVARKIESGIALPLRYQGDVVGCLERGHDQDDTLAAPVLLENLACKATAYLALEYLLQRTDRASIDYLINSGEEAVGDRYQRGAGNLAKAIGEQARCANATGADVKAFCCGPAHAIVIAASLVHAGVFRQVVVLGGGALAKLGMKFLGHLRHDLPVLEDVMAGMAILVGPDDGESPQIRLDAIGRHTIRAGATPPAMAEALVLEPLGRLGRRISDIDRYAVELHNPDVTEPAGSGNVPYTNYRTLAALAAMRGEIPPTELTAFIAKHGLPGFAPTQGHIPSAVSYMGHALDAIVGGEMRSVMFVAKGSLFLGKMTQLSDGISFLLEANS
jgi:hypothetical protein